jgi:hypothetical protein
MKKFSFALAFAIVALFTTGSAFAGNGQTQQKYTFCNTIYNACCDEYIEYCLDVHLTFDKNGSLTHANASGKGTGSNGTSYNLNVTQNQHENIHDNGGGNYTVVVNQNIIATGGSDCGQVWQVQIHVTVNANGTTTATVENIDISCDNGTAIS